MAPVQRHILLVISLGERTFYCLLDAALIPDGEVVAIE
jgi:hypothetical protein